MCLFQIWAYWLSPYSWALRALGVNELMTPRWNDQPYPDDPSIGLGEGALNSFAYYTGGCISFAYYTGGRNNII